MVDLIIRPTIGAGNKIIIQDQAGQPVLTTADSGGALNNVTGTLSEITPGTSGNLLTSDGTNWTSVALDSDLITIAGLTPGTSGNLLTSDGTNWTSAAAAGGGGGGGAFEYLGSVGRATNNTANWSSGQNPNKGKQTHRIPFTSGIATAGSQTFQNFLVFIEGIDAFYDGNNVGMQFYCSALESNTKPVSSLISYTMDARRGDGTTAHSYSNTATTVPLQNWSSGGLTGGGYSTYEHYRVQAWIYVTNVTARVGPRLSWTTTSNYGGRTDSPYGQLTTGMATLANGSGSATFDNSFTDLLICATGGHDDRRYLADQFTSNSVKLWGIKDS
tara:strand:+ start:99 stop:1088 length:990 start_codon:yes stop_codon:yes gene_type:complete